MMWRVGTVVALQDETATARTITLKVPDWPGHIAGQHVDVRLTASDGYSRGVRHCSAHGYDSLACVDGQYRAVSIIVFRARTGSGFLPR